MNEERRERCPWAGLTEAILAAAMKVQDALGPGLLESAYEACLVHELRKRGHRVVTQVSLDITYDGLRVPHAFRLDMLVDDTVVVELKALDQLQEVHAAQLLTYLRLAQRPVGLLINFWAYPLKKGGIKRITNARPS